MNRRLRKPPRRLERFEGSSSDGVEEGDDVAALSKVVAFDGMRWLPDHAMGRSFRHHDFTHS